MEKNAKIYVAGHRGLVGSALVRELQAQGYINLVYRTHEELDLINQQAVKEFFDLEKPDYVFLAAAKVGGIMANIKYPAEFTYQNLQIQNNVIHEAYLHNVKKLIFLGSTCIYPRECPQPMKEEYFLTGPFEPTNEGYAVAKTAGMKMCQYYNLQYGTNYISVMPTNLYGPNDNFEPITSHLFPGLIRKFSEAISLNVKEIKMWGTGVAKREFLHVDDMAKACIYLMNTFSPTKEQNEKGEIFFNLGTGEDLSIYDLAYLFKKILDYKGEIVWDPSKPDGMPRKLTDVTRIHNLGWKHEIGLEEGIRSTFEWYKNNVAV